MAFIDPTTPSLADFVTFCQGQGVPEIALDTMSPYYDWAYTYADNVVIYVPQMPSILYVIAVYNLGMHKLVEIAQDTAPSTFFADARKAFNILAFALPIASSADQATSQTGVVPEWLKNATLATMDLLKTIWGRNYLDYAQQYGSSIIDVS